MAEQRGGGGGGGGGVLGVFQAVVAPGSHLILSDSGFECEISVINLKKKNAF